MEETVNNPKTHKNEAAIKLLNEWLSRPPVKELRRWRTWVYIGRLHRDEPRCVWPAFLYYSNSLDRIIGIPNHRFSLRWWKWEIAITLESHVYATEPIEQ